jgi:hypothetical protein
MRQVVARVIPALLLALPACRPSPTLGTFTTDTLPGGIVRARSTGPTVWTDTAGWRLVREREFRPSEESGVGFGRGGMLVADEEQGDIYVLDRGPAIIKRFDRAGRFLGTIGREGAGPGEFRDNGNLYLVDSLLVHHSPELGRFSVFAPGGRLVRAFPSISRIGVLMRADRGGRIPVLIERAGPDGRIREGVARYRIDGTVADSLWYPEAPETPTWNVKRGNSTIGVQIPLTPARQTALDAGGALLWGDQGSGAFVVSRDGVDTIRIIEVDLPPSPVTDHDRQQAIDSLTARLKWLVGVARVEEVPEERPRWDLIEPDGAGYLWILRTLPSGTRRWSVVAPDGRWIGDVPAPFGSVTASFWGRDRVYLLTEGADALPQIEVWRIDRSLR